MYLYVLLPKIFQILSEAQNLGIRSAPPFKNRSVRLRVSRGGANPFVFCTCAIVTFVGLGISPFWNSRSTWLFILSYYDLGETREPRCDFAYCVVDRMERCRLCLGIAAAAGTIRNRRFCK